MKIKETFTFETAAEVMRKELSSHINVIIRSNILDSNKKWFDIDKSSFVGVRVTFFSDRPLVVSYVPNFFARAFFGGLISGVFHHGARSAFKKQIEQFVISEFYQN